MADSILGKITDQAGAGMKDVKVSATNSQGAVAGPVMTNASGNYAITSLAAGAYTVSAEPPAGFQTPAPKTGVNVTAGQDTANIDFQLSLIPSITGRVMYKDPAKQKPRQVTATQIVTTNGQQAPVSVPTDNNGNYVLTGLKPGNYTVKVDSLAGEPAFLTANNVAVAAGVTASGIDFSEDVVRDFLDRLDDARFSIESLISEEEARQAVSLFSVVNLMLAGHGRRQVNNEDKMDMLGVLNLFYGLQEDSLRAKITVANPTALWNSLEGELRELAKDLDQLQSDADFLSREAKRQFNLGLSNGVLGNVAFPGLFRRYVEIGSDPLLSFDIKAADNNQFFDKTKIAQADDLLRELKSVILQLVRSLSKYGTAATRRVNEDWAEFEARALEVLSIVARDRVTPDQDERNAWAVLADLTNKQRDSEVAPYVVLARHGGKLLNYAMTVYGETLSLSQLDDFSPSHLRNLFQRGNNQRDFWTERIRTEANVITRYPLRNWG